MNVQRIQLNLSPTLSKSNWDVVKQRMSFSTEKNRKISISTASKNIESPLVGLNDFELALLAAGVWFTNPWLVKVASLDSIYPLQRFDAVDAVSDVWVIAISPEIVCSATLILLCVFALKIQIRFHMNVQRIQLNLSPIFSESKRNDVHQEMSFSTEKIEKCHLCRMKNWSCMTRDRNYNILGCF